MFGARSVHSRYVVGLKKKYTANGTHRNSDGFLAVRDVRDDVLLVSQQKILAVDSQLRFVQSVKGRGVLSVTRSPRAIFASPSNSRKISYDWLIKQ